MKVPTCLRKIAPHWADHISKSKSYASMKEELTLDGVGVLNIANMGFCIVGEAWKFTRAYHPSSNQPKIQHIKEKPCEVCTDFSYAFAYLRKPEVYTEPSEMLISLSFTELAKQFCQHMQSAHHKLVEMKQ